MGLVQAIINRNSLDRTNAVCDFNSFIYCIGSVDVVVYRDRIAYEDNTIYNQCYDGCSALGCKKTIYYRDIQSLDKHTGNPVEWAMLGIRIRTQTDAIFIYPISNHNVEKIQHLYLSSRHSNRYR